ncbi:MAG: hypothetical protein C4524_07765 [Candidatus Zixiibacteriota bacterium]|nr:MAG: hypothetical protein C4524_07765 [candidate division Zixibacteria bacterium]
MAGFSRIYCIGGEGGFMGADGINPILLQILVSDAHRQWLEPHYFNHRIQPMGQVRVIIPESPDHPDMLLDACMAFFPEAFKSCPSFEYVANNVGSAERIDFEAHGEPLGWYKLRQEAKPIFEQMGIWRADLVQISPQRIPPKPQQPLNLPR